MSIFLSFFPSWFKHLTPKSLGRLYSDEVGEPPWTSRIHLVHWIENLEKYFPTDFNVFHSWWNDEIDSFSWQPEVYKACGTETRTGQAF